MFEEENRPHETMRVVVSDSTRELNAIFDQLVAAWAVMCHSIVPVARIYREYIERGGDPAKVTFIPEKMRFKLMRLSDPRLLPELVDHCGGSAPVVNVAAALPFAKQRDWLENGVEVWRDGKTQTVPLLEVKKKECKWLVDATGGSARVVSPHEQRQRQEAIPVKPSDTLIEVRLNPVQMAAATVLARKRGRSVRMYLMEMLIESGAFDTK